MKEGVKVEAISNAVILSGQGTSAAEICFNKHTATTPLYMQVQVEITNSLGVKTRINKEVLSKPCVNCPEI